MRTPSFPSVRFPEMAPDRPRQKFVRSGALAPSLSWDMFEPLADATPMDESELDARYSFPFSRKRGFFVVVYETAPNARKAFVMEDGSTARDILQELHRQFKRNASKKQNHRFFEGIRIDGGSGVMEVEQGS